MLVPRVGTVQTPAALRHYRLQLVVPETNMTRVVLFLLIAASAIAADYRAGVARVNITPTTPIWLSGYASRQHPSDGVIHDLWAKALAIDDSKGNRIVIVTTDLIGLSRPISELVAARVQKQYGLDRSQLLLNSSHTHTGPLIKANLELMFELNDDDMRVLQAYSQKLTDDLVSVIGAALGKLAPARVVFGQGQAGFAANRRQPVGEGVKIGVNKTGPVDHSVPVLKVIGSDGRPIAILFGYACHNTTLTGEFYGISGDYAGFAQSEVEKANPGATAMFLMLCGADQNPYPRSSLQLAQQHGNTLATEVNRVLSGRVQRVKGRIRSAFQIVEPEFQPHTRETFEKLLASSNSVQVRNAKMMLRAYDDGRPIRRVPYPVQAIRFGSSVTLVALGGEVVVDYALRIKREYPNENIVVAGYSNDVMCYIPSRRILREGGYEAVDSMIYYGQPGPFTEEVEETIFGTIHQVLSRVGRKAPR